LVKKFDSIILTSGTISPMDFYSRILKLDKVINASIEPNWLRDSISPLIIGRASDQSLLTTAFSERGNSIISKNYGELLYELSRYVPDGIVCFFPSYSYMEEIVTDWKKLGLIEEITKNKMLFIETKDQRMTSEALQSYKNAIERGRGGIFLCVARGKVAEGVDFKNHLGRCAYVIGIPFQYTKSRALLCRTEYLENKLGINQKEYVLYDAMKQTAQCLGRVFRGKMDYGLLILADSRYNEEKISVLPKWIKNHVKPENLKLHSNIAIPLAKKFFSDMSKDYTIPKDIYYTKGDFNEN
jgi:DNA excision repair protein ERCC-2